MGLDGSGLQSGLKGAQAAVQSFVSKLRSIGGLIAGVFAAGGIKAFADECIEANKAQMESEIKLQTVMRQRMKATDEEVQSIKNLASAQQNLGVVGDEVQLAGAQQMATFLDNKKSMEALIPAMNNLLAQQKGLNASQGDAVNIGNLMGKVMQGQTGALKKVGITFTAAEEAALKFGTEEERAAVLAKIITNNVGEMNKALAETDEGKMQQLANNIGDMKEQIGAALVPILGELSPGIGEFAQTLTDKLVGAITWVRENFTTLAAHITAVFAGISVAKMIQRVSASFTSFHNGLVTKANVASAQVQGIEMKMLNLKEQIEKRKAMAAEKGYTEESAFCAKTKALEEQLDSQEAAHHEACAKQKAAADQVSAYESGRWWQKGMMMAKTAMAGFVKSSTAMLKSFALTAVIMIAVEALMKLQKQLGTSNKSFQALAGRVKELCSKAFSWLVKSIGQAVDWLFNIEEQTGAVSGVFMVLGATMYTAFKIVQVPIKALVSLMKGLGGIAGEVAEMFKQIGAGNWDGAKAAVSRMASKMKDWWNNSHEFAKGGEEIASAWKSAFAAFDSSAEAVNRRKTTYSNSAKSYGSGGDSGGSGGDGGKSTGKHGTTKTDKTPAQQAAEDVKEAEKSYAAAIADAKRQLEQGLIKEAEYEAEVLKAIESKYDAYAKALDDTSDQKYKTELDKVAEEIKKQRGVIKSRTDKEEVLAYLADQENDATQKHISAIDNAVKALREQAEVEAKGRDRSGDWKITGKDRDQQIAKLDLQYDLENAKKTLDILKTAVANGADGFAAELEAQMQKVSSLEDALNLSEAIAKVKELKQELQKTTLESIEQGWSTIQGLVDCIMNTLEKLKDPDATGWEKFCAVMTQFFAIISAVQTVMGIVQTIQGIMNALSLAGAAAKGSEATATITSTAAKTAEIPVLTAHATATKAAAAATEQLAAAEIMAAHAAIPFAGVAIGGGQVAAMEGILAGVKAASHFSTGGTVQGSFAHGDFIPAWLNAGETVLTPNQGNRLLNLADGKASPAASKSIPDHIYLHADGRELSACIDTNARHNARM